MRRRIFLALAAAASLIAVSCTPKCAEVRNAEALASRIMGGASSKVCFELVESSDSLDCFELSSRGSKVVIAGNNAGAMATGLNYYLKNYCDVAVSWYDFNPVVMPKTLPAVPEPVKVHACVETRFFLNYCTFGYTMPFWGWKEWERLIDWMALNGVNMPLAITGQEAVWQKVWQKYGMTEEQTRAFFTGPVYLPWQRMVNIDRYDGPLPQSWIDSQADLQKKIVERERSLGMKPVLPAFAGHIPAEIKELHPEINATPVGGWGGFGEEYQCTFLNSLDPMYEQIQRDFLAEQTAMYGTDHVYGIDLFNEVDPPSWDAETLATISAHVYESLAAVDPDAKWLQMGWLFFNDRKHWTPDLIKAYMGAVPQGKVILLDYFAERREIWRTTDCFAGQPFIWCNLGNFGGNTALDGDPIKVAGLIENSMKDAGSLMNGIGCTLEAFGVNEFMFEFVLGQAWRKDGGEPLRSIDEWGEVTADSHFGSASEPFREAWKMMCKDIYHSNASARATLNNSRPCLHGYGRWCNDSIFYDNSTLRKVLELMLEEKSGNELYKYDVVNVARQYLGNCFIAPRDAFAACYEAGDKAGADRWWGVMMEMLDDMDELLACRDEFSLAYWLGLARAYGQTPEESDYYEKNARQLITTWAPRGSSLNDYANRAYAGLMKNYYKVRWEMWRDRIDDPTFDSDLLDFEHNWSENTLGWEPEVRGDAYSVASRILEKY